MTPVDTDHWVQIISNVNEGGMKLRSWLRFRYRSKTNLLIPELAKIEAKRTLLILHLMVRRGSVMVRRGSVMVRRGSDMVRRGSVMVQRGSVMVRRGSVMVRRGSVDSASACCKASPSSNLGSAPHGGVSHWAYKRWGNEERPRQMATDKCIVWMWLNECMYVCYKIKYENKQKEWHPVTKCLYILHLRKIEAKRILFIPQIRKIDVERTLIIL